MAQEKHPEKIIVGPHITEKSFDQREKGKFDFKVHPKASKTEIKNAVEQTYNVDVVKVNTTRIPSKKRKRAGGAITGHTPGYKKAIITLKEGQKIEALEH